MKPSSFVALVALLLAPACGRVTARLPVAPDLYDHTQLVGWSRCDVDEGGVELHYALVSAQKKAITEGDALVRGGVSVSVAEPFAIEGRAEVVGATVVSDRYTKIAAQGAPRAFAFLMDNSQSLNGFDEATRARIPLTDPNDQRIAGLQNFVHSERFTSADRATLLAFHGEGQAGLDAKLAADGSAPSPAWFTSSRTTLAEAASQLPSQELGRTPLYDAIQLGGAALATMRPAAVPITLIFSEGPDNASSATFERALTTVRARHTGALFAVVAGYDAAALRALACASSPRGVVVDSHAAATILKAFDPLQYATTGYWTATLRLATPSLPPGAYTVKGRVFADPADAPRACEGSGATACPPSMACDEPTRRCFLRVSFPLTVR